MKSAKRRSSNSGFTLVELLVSMALMLFIMVILVEAFGAGMDTFQGLRALGDLQEQLRNTAQVIQNDLAQDHFESGRRCSDADFWTEPRREGFFAIRQPTKLDTATSFITEGGAACTDLDGNPAYRATDHILHFSNRLRGNGRDKYVYDNTAPDNENLAAPVYAVFPKAAGPASQVSYHTTDRLDLDTLYSNESTTRVLTSPWCEVAYVLVPQDGVKQPALTDPAALTDASIPKVYLHNLYRIQLLVVPYAEQIYNKIPFSSSTDSYFLYTSRNKWVNGGGNYQFYSPNDLARGATTRSFQLTPPFTTTDPPPAGQTLLRGQALLCTNVVSFQVRVLRSTGTKYEDLNTDLNVGPPAMPATDLFDTATNPPPNFRLLGVQVIMRVFDPSSGLTRQITVAQDQ